MRYDFIFAGVLFSLASVMLVATLFLATRKERLVGLRTYAFLALVNFVYLLAEGMYVLADGVGTLLFLSHIQYLAISFLGVIWFLVSYQHSVAQSTLPTRMLFGVLTLPVLFVIANWLHGVQFVAELDWLSRLFFVSHEVVSNGGLGEGYTTLVFLKGPFYYLMMVYQFVMGVASGGLYLGCCFRKRSLVTRKRGFALAGSSFLFALFALSGLFFEQTLFFDVPPFLAVIIFVLGFNSLYRYELFDLVPRAYNLVFDNANEPIIILDQFLQVVKFNAAATRYFEPRITLRSRMSANELEPDVEEFAATLLTLGKMELRQKDDTYLLVGMQAMRGDSKRNTGYLLSYQDITGHKNELMRLETMASLDDLTKIYNRRYFFKLATTCFDEAVAMHQPISVIMFDLDNFKEANDIYGHQAGDVILETMAAAMKKALSDIDIFARYGGEEFIIFRKNKTLSDSASLAQHLCSMLAGMEFAYQKRKMKVTASFGVSGTEKTITKSLEQTIKDADVALYRAKKLGKNQVSLDNRVSP
jgi:diguanylate cyclase (GGDEF)-like protein